jgi:photosystem II stability/assembly factor-like uncharacterized protein
MAALGLITVASVEPLSAQDPGRNTAYDSTLFDALSYRMVGPFRGGRSTAVTGVPGEVHTFLMGTTGGGVWKTDDAGMHWRNISDGHFGGSIGSVAIAPSDANVVYVGTGSDDIRGNTSTGRGAWRSTDGGKSWSFIGLAETGQIGRIQVHPDDPDLVYAAALGHPFGKNPERGIFRSRDGGATWEHVLALSDSTGASDLSMNPRNPRELYAGMWRGERKPWALISGGAEGGVYKSTDGGDSWEKLEGGLPTGVVGKVGVAVSPADPERVWAIIQHEPDGGVWRSDDAGKQWARVNGDNSLRQRAFYYTQVVADPSDKNTVWGLNVRLHRSIDGGVKFEEVAVPHGDIHDLWINPDDSRIMIVGDDGGGQVTLNAAESWSTYLNQPTAEFYDVIVDNAFPYRLYAGQQDNSTISVPAWQTRNALSAREGWENVGGCETGPIGLHPDHPEIVYGGCYSGIIDRWDRTTQQRRWIQNYTQEQSGEAGYNLKYRFQWVSPIVVSPHDPNVVYHASQYVHRTTDGGMNWETISPDLTTNDRALQEYAGGPIDHDITGVEVFNTVFSLAISPHSEDVIWAGTDDGRVHLTRDGGASWSDVTPSGMPARGTVDEIDLSVHQPGRAFVAVQRYREDDWRPHIFRTNDFGATWESLATGTNGIPSDYPVRTVREDPERRGLIYAGTEFGVFVSFDDGRNWQPLQLDLPITPVTGMRVAHDDLILSTQGRSFWILDDVTPLRQLDPAVAGSAVHLYAPRTAYRSNAHTGEAEDVSPAGLPGKALIHFYLADELEGEEEVRIRIHDSADRLVREFTSDSATADAERIGRMKVRAGMNRLGWDLTYAGPVTLKDAVISGYEGGVKAPPGTYRVSLMAAGESLAGSLEVVADPREPRVTQEEYEEQYRLGAAIRDTVTRVYDGLRQIRSAREQVASIGERVVKEGYAAELGEHADTLGTRLEAVEDALRQTKNESNQDALRYSPKLDTQYLNLYAYVTGEDNYSFGGPDGRPSAGAYERFDDLNAEWAILRQRLRTVLETDVPAFNEALLRNGVQAVIVPRVGSTPLVP